MELKLKSKNLIIYPIIIYTDPSFSVLGMESYLHEEFVKKLNAKGVNNSFKSIKRLSFINIDFFIEHFLMLQKCTYRLDKLIDIYDKRLKEYKKKYLKDETLESHFNSYKTFEDIWSNKNKGVETLPKGIDDWCSPVKILTSPEYEPPDSTPT